MASSSLPQLPKNLNITSWVMQGLAAIVFLAMGAIPKLTGDMYAVQLFEQVGLGPAGMYATGAAELLAAVLIMIPKTNWIGAGLGVLLMLGAIGSHLTKLGIVVEFTSADGVIEKNPMLFPLAVLMLGLCLGVFALRKLHPASATSAGAATEPPPAAESEAE